MDSQDARGWPWPLPNPPHPKKKNKFISHGIALKKFIYLDLSPSNFLDPSLDVEVCVVYVK